MRSFFKRFYFFNFDLLPTYSNEQKRIQRLKVINFFLVFALFVFVVNDAVLAILKIQPYTFEKFPILIFWIITLIALWLTKKGKYLASKLIVLFSFLLFISTYALTGYIIGEHFLWQPIALLGLSVIPFLVLDLRKERGWLFLFFLLFLFYTIFHDQIMMAGSDDRFRRLFTHLNTTPFIYNAVRIIIYLFLTSIIYYSIRLNEHQQLLTERINQSLLETTNHLETLNAELQAQRNAINKSASLIIADHQQKIVTANDNFLSISGYSIRELQGQKATGLISNQHDEAFFKDLEDTIDAGEVWRGEVKIRRKDGSCFWMNTAISTILYPGDKEKGYLIIMFDITKLKNDEERLEKLNYEKDRILYAVAHDLKNPLLNFEALLNLIKSGKLKKEEEQEIFRLMTRDQQHSINLIAELLDIGRLEDENFKLEKKAVDLNDFLDKSMEQFEKPAQKKSIVLTKSWDKRVTSVRVNEMEFVRVIRNLISNAIKFTPSGGEIRIKTLLLPGSKVSIEISDSGIGISKELLPIIFDKFSKARRKGIDGEKSTGLGMWIVKHIVSLHGGEISVKSLENNGTTFTIILPVRT